MVSYRVGMAHDLQRLWLTGGVLADGSGVDLEIVDGVITQLAPPGSASAEGARYELDGRLVIESFAEPHAHLDKALTADRVPNPDGDLMGAIAGWIAAAEAGEFTLDDTATRAAAAMEKLLVNGVTAIRTHVNVGEANAIGAVRAVRRAAESFAGLIDVQIVALTASPMTGAAGAANRTALLEAIEEGVDLVGGCPHLDTDPDRMIDDVVRIATDAGLGLDLHVDETLAVDVLSLEVLARVILETGFEFGVTASHCVSLGMQPLDVQRRVAALVAEAQIAVVTLPQTNLFLQGRDLSTAVPRGLTAVAALLDAGVSVVAGGDNVEDPFNPLGRSDPLETAALLVMAGHTTVETALELVTSAPHGLIRGGPVDAGRSAGRLVVGQVADLVAIAAPTGRAAVAAAPHDRSVFKAGVLVAESREHRRVLR